MFDSNLMRIKRIPPSEWWADGTFPWEPLASVSHKETIVRLSVCTLARSGVRCSALLLGGGGELDI
jgi:hypothetical protein